MPVDDVVMENPIKQLRTGVAVGSRERMPPFEVDDSWKKNEESNFARIRAARRQRERKTKCQLAVACALLLAIAAGIAFGLYSANSGNGEVERSSMSSGATPSAAAASEVIIPNPAVDEDVYLVSSFSINGLSDTTSLDSSSNRAAMRATIAKALSVSESRVVVTAVRSDPRSSTGAMLVD